ncbi:MAG TPA: GTP cyclohydrolase I, partial [Gemmatimonadaceae bacterium]|nr:GTP cyclohydrolase I [Gemmatimonadaceae bacterium]
MRETDDVLPEYEALIRRELELIGEDPTREGILKTPGRVAKAMLWMTQGYQQDARTVIGDAMFAEAHNNMVLVRDIE